MRDRDVMRQTIVATAVAVGSSRTWMWVQGTPVLALPLIAAAVAFAGWGGARRERRRSGTGRVRSTGVSSGTG